MKIDWFTLVAQIINFAVLVWLLRLFLFDRIVQAMKEREQKIIGRLDEAAALRQEAMTEKQRYQALIHEFEQNRDERLKTVQAEAEAQFQKLMSDARARVEVAQTQWLKTLQRERTDLLQDIRERVGHQVIAVTRQALCQLASEDLESLILKTFLRRLESEKCPALTQVAGGDGHDIEIRTSYPVSEESRQQVLSSLSKTFNDNVNVEFTTSKDLICGVELRVQSQRFTWSLDSYLTGLEETLFQTLEENAIHHAQFRGE